MAITSANQLELLQTAEAVAREKMIEPSLVIEAMEESLARAAKSRYGADLDIHVVHRPQDGPRRPSPACAPSSSGRDGKRQGEFTTVERPSPISPPQRRADEYWLRDGQRIDPTETEPQIGDSFHEAVPPVDMGRIAAQSAKQVILQKVREAERERQYEEFKDRAGTIINGVVKREEYGNVIVDIGRGEASCAATTRSGAKLSQRRPHPLLHQGRAPRDARAAGVPVAHRAGIHGRAVQDGSARDLRRHHRDQGRGP
jgi:N utilization substance protein A